MNYSTRNHLVRLKNKAFSALRDYTSNIKFHNATDDALDTANELASIADNLLDFCDKL